jgi:GTPase
LGAGQVAGNQVRRLRVEREVVGQGKQVRRGIQGRVEWGIQDRVAGLTTGRTGDRDQSQSRQNCSREEHSVREGETGPTGKQEQTARHMD